MSRPISPAPSAAQSPPAGLDPAEVGPFLARLVRLDRSALVRLRAGGPGGLALWGRLPWEVLVTRRVSGGPTEPAGGTGTDVTVSGRELLARLAGVRSPGSGTAVRLDLGHLPPARDHEWRWPLPTGPGTPVESLPPGELRRIGVAAARTIQEASEKGIAGQAVGSRILRDTLLDHIPIVVESGGQRIEIRQRLVQAVLRMDFLGTQDVDTVTVRKEREWVCLAARYGDVWHRNGATLAIRFVH